MTALELQDALAARVERLAAGTQMRDIMGKPGPVAVYTQNVPIRTGPDTGGDARRPEPYVLIALAGGGRESGTALYETAEVLISAVVGDTGPDRQGHRDVLHLLEMIRLDLTAHPVVERVFRYKGDVQWALRDMEGTACAGAMLLTFEWLAPQEEICPFDGW